MPISYEQPQPFAPAISEAYGAAQAYQQAMPEIVRNQEEIARINEQGMQRGQGAFEQQQNRIQHFSDQQQQVAEQQAQRVQQQQLQQQKFQQQQQLQKMDFSQADGLRMQKLQQGMAGVQEAMDNGTVSPEEGNQLMLQIKSGIDPLQQRQEQTRQKMMEQQGQIQMDQHARQAAMDKQAADFMRTDPTAVRDENGKLHGFVYPAGFDNNGRPKQGHMAAVKDEKDTAFALEQKQAEDRRKEAMKQQQHDEDHESTLYHGYVKQAESETKMEQAQHNKEGQNATADPWGPPSIEDIHNRAEQHMDEHSKRTGKTRPSKKGGGAQAPAVSPGQPAPAAPADKDAIPPGWTPEKEAAYQASIKKSATPAQPVEDEGWMKRWKKWQAEHNPFPHWRPDIGI